MDDRDEDEDGKQQLPSVSRSDGRSFGRSLPVGRSACLSQSAAKSASDKVGECEDEDRDEESRDEESKNSLSSSAHMCPFTHAPLHRM